MSKKTKIYFDIHITISISKEQDKKLERLANKFDGNKSRVIRDFLNKAK